MISKPLNEIVFADLEALITNQVMEGRTIEYKQQVSLSTDNDKKEFLADVSSFANAAGGDLIIGMKANNGIPETIVGIPSENIDALILQMESLVRDGIANRINGIIFQKISSYSNHALLIHIPKSWSGPHQVVLKGTDKFYNRSSNGKYKMDITELRSAFVATNTATEQMRKFVKERIAEIEADEGPVPMGKKGKILIQLIPYSSLQPGFSIEIQSKELYNLRPLGVDSYTPKYNLNGVINYPVPHTNEKRINGYVQVYKNGIIETGNSEYLHEYMTGQLIIPVSSGLNYEIGIVDALTNYLDFYQKAGIGFPVVVFISLIHVKDYYVATEGRGTLFKAGKLDKDIIRLPEIIVNRIDDNIPLLLKPVFDTIWNGCGHAGSQNYDQAGTWRPR
ncbi:MAG: ATP-binding protein [Bacteroidetes bacterium]|nr:ATP-binding protein [Bacteroidota bacterium]